MLWTWERWREAAPLFEPLMESERGGAVRCAQLGAKGKAVRFSKLAWNDSSHQRWTHGSPVTGEESPGGDGALGCREWGPPEQLSHAGGQAAQPSHPARPWPHKDTEAESLGRRLPGFAEHAL